MGIFSTAGVWEYACSGLYSLLVLALALRRPDHYSRYLHALICVCVCDVCIRVYEHWLWDEASMEKISSADAVVMEPWQRPLQVGRKNSLSLQTESHGARQASKHTYTVKDQRMLLIRTWIASGKNPLLLWSHGPNRGSSLLRSRRLLGEGSEVGPWLAMHVSSLLMCYRIIPLLHMASYWIISPRGYDWVRWDMNL